MSDIVAFTDIMVDIETGGTDPSHSPILQIAAVKFDLATKQVDATSMFDRCLRIPEGRFWDESTRAWWANQNQAVFQDIVSRAEDPKTVLIAFADWVGYQNPKPVKLWAKPISFEWAFIQGYFRQFEVPNPFHYRYGRDLNTYLEGKGVEDPFKFAKTIPFDGDAHNALHDVLNQIKVLFSC
jgi:hypothetical protein